MSHPTTVVDATTSEYRNIYTVTYRGDHWPSHHEKGVEEVCLVLVDGQPEAVRAIRVVAETLDGATAVAMRVLGTRVLEVVSVDRLIGEEVWI